MLLSPALAATFSARVVNGEGSPVDDAVVYALPEPGTTLPARVARTARVEQRDREFVPYVSAVRTGTSVQFPNRDPLMHHVYSFSPAKPFEIKLYSGILAPAIVFDKPGVVTLGCNIHDWMIGYILVVDTPYFGRTDAKGEVQLDEVQPGDYRVHVWHPLASSPVPPRNLRIDAGSAAEVMLTLDVQPRKKRFKPPLNPAQYR